jgi:hypothetical protein
LERGPHSYATGPRGGRLLRKLPLALAREEVKLQVFGLY